jgi:hypothetical protein
MVAEKGKPPWELVISMCEDRACRWQPWTLQSFSQRFARIKTVSFGLEGASFTFYLPMQLAPVISSFRSFQLIEH